MHSWHFFGIFPLLDIVMCFIYSCCELVFSQKHDNPEQHDLNFDIHLCMNNTIYLYAIGFIVTFIADKQTSCFRCIHNWFVRWVGAGFDICSSHIRHIWCDNIPISWGPYLQRRGCQRLGTNCHQPFPTSRIMYGLSQGCVKYREISWEDYVETPHRGVRILRIHRSKLLILCKCNVSLSLVNTWTGRLTSSKCVTIVPNIAAVCKCKEMGSPKTYVTFRAFIYWRLYLA